MINAGLAFVVEDIEDGYGEKLHKALVCMPLSLVFSRHTGGLPHFIDEPTTGLDPEERIRIRNLLVDFSEGRTVLFSTHVVEDLTATCNQLAVMKKGEFLYSGTMRELLKQAEGHVWICKIKDEGEVRELERRYHVSSKQYVGDELHVKLISAAPPRMKCSPCEATLEDAYIYIANKEKVNAYTKKGVDLS